MANINWPSGATTGDTYTSPDGDVWTWTGYAWEGAGSNQPGPIGPTGPTGAPGPADGDGIYGGSGTIPGDIVVAVNSNTIQFDSLPLSNGSSIYIDAVNLDIIFEKYLEGSVQRRGILYGGAFSGDQTWTLPNATGTIALTDDIGDILWTSGSAGTGSITTVLGGNSATQSYAVAMGFGTIASGYYSHAEGYQTDSSNQASHAEGYRTVASGIRGSHAEGWTTIASGDSSHAEGQNTNAIGVASHAQGLYTTAGGNYSHAEGKQSDASGYYSHAEGEQTNAIGAASHAEGIGSTAGGNYSHAEGQQTNAIGVASHAQGFYTTAGGNYSHAGGYGSETLGESSFVHGRNNYLGTGATNSAMIGGTGLTGNSPNTTYVPSLEIQGGQGFLIGASGTTAQIDAAGDRILVTKEWVQAEIGGTSGDQTLAQTLAAGATTGGTNIEAHDLFELTRGLTGGKVIFDDGKNNAIVRSGATAGFRELNIGDTGIEILHDGIIQIDAGNIDLSIAGSTVLSITNNNIFLSNGVNFSLGTGAYVPTSTGATGFPGTITYDDDYIYVCTALNTWKRTQINTW